MSAQERITYDEFGLFHENCSEYGLPLAEPPTVRRETVEVEPGRSLSALVWGTGDPEIVLLHGGSQNAHTWDTVALALRPRPLIAIDLPGQPSGVVRRFEEAGHSIQGDMPIELAATIQEFIP